MPPWCTRSSVSGACTNKPKIEPPVGSSANCTIPFFAFCNSSAVAVKRATGWRFNSLKVFVTGLNSRYLPLEIKLKAPTRTTSCCAFSPPCTITSVVKRLTLPCSVISRCNSNHTFSISSIEASFEVEPIFCASSSINVLRPAISADTTEVANLLLESPATC